MIINDIAIRMKFNFVVHCCPKEMQHFKIFSFTVRHPSDLPTFEESSTIGTLVLSNLEGENLAWVNQEQLGAMFPSLSTLFISDSPMLCDRGAVPSDLGFDLAAVDVTIACPHNVVP